MKTNLKPCPFCGIIPKIRKGRNELGTKYVYIRCTNGECSMSLGIVHTGFHGIKEIAIKAWNNREV